MRTDLLEEKNFLINMLQEKLHLGELDIDTILRVSERLYYLGMEEGSQPLDNSKKGAETNGREMG